MTRPEAKDVMTEGVVSIGKEASVKEAAEIMREEDIRSLVVVEGDEAVGIIAGKDLLYGVVAENKNPSEVRVEEIMTSQLITAGEHDDVSDLARAMIKHNISRIPILRGETLVGIVTQTNIMEAWPGYMDLLEERASRSAR